MADVPHSELLYGDLFVGYDGLGAGIRSVLGGRTAWYADVCRFDKDGHAGHYTPHRSPCSIMEHNLPGVPNLGDVSAIDWASVPKVDVITGGSPCQDLSHAGKRAGMKAGTRSGLWASMCDAVDIIRPSLVVWENVRGALSAEATSAVEPCPFCMGGGTDGTLRALGRVLGDLAELGYDARWYGLRAADVGAAHSRFRIFLFATPADPGRRGRASLPEQLLEPARHWASAPADARRWADDGGAGLLIPTPTANDHKGSTTSRREPGQHRGQLDAFAEGATLPLLPTPAAHDSSVPTDPAVRKERGYGPQLVDVPLLLPTPAVNDMGEGKTPEQWDDWTEEMKARYGNGNGHGRSLAVEAIKQVQSAGTHSQSLDQCAWCHGLVGTHRTDCIAAEPEVLLPTPRAGDGADASSHGRTYSATDYNLHNAARDLSLFPTPTASEDGGAGRSPAKQGGDNLRTAVLLPTPRSQNAEERNQNIWRRPDGEPQNLENALAHVLEPDDDEGDPEDEGFLPGLMDLVRLLPTPRATRGGSSTETREALMPTPLTSDAAGGPADPYARGDRAQIVDVARQLLPTPQTVDAVFNTPASERNGKQVGLSMMGAEPTQDWREYGPAIRRWEAVVGRPAPAPTDSGPKGQPRLSPRFVEWLMGLPEGHVTDVPTLTRPEALKALGNGVVPQQAAAATIAFLQDALALYEQHLAEEQASA